MLSHALLTVLAATLLDATPVVLAARRAKPRPAPAQPTPVEPAPTPQAAPAGPIDEPALPKSAPRDTSGMNTDALLNAADGACRSLDYDVCIELAGRALARPDINEEQQARGYTLQAGAYAVVGQSVEAERPYRLLLRIRPDFDLPKETPPKILAVFRKVQAEENEIRQAVQEASRRKLIASIKLAVDVPARHRGGTPLVFTARVTDPLRGIASLTLAYRFQKSAPFASMPFQRDDKGTTASFSAAQMSTDQPLRMEYLVLARDADGALLTTLHSEAQPGSLEVDAGQVAGPPLWQQPRMWVLGGAGAGALGAGGVLLLAAAAAAATVGSGVIFLLLRGDGVTKTALGKQNV